MGDTTVQMSYGIEKKSKPDDRYECNFSPQQRGVIDPNLYTKLCGDGLLPE